MFLFFYINFWIFILLYFGFKWEGEEGEECNLNKFEVLVLKKVLLCVYIDNF